MPKKILFLVPYPLGESPSQRFRFEQYFPILLKGGYQFDVQTFLDTSNWKLFFQPGRPIQKTAALLKGFARRWIVPFHALSYDYIFIHRETTPLGPPVLEWILAKILRRKIIYDFDDAIWLTDRKNESILLKIAKWRSKVSSICAWSYKVSCGNDYLCSYARKFNNNVHFIPTTIDTEHVHNRELVKSPDRVEGKISIGWTGSHSTLKYLLDLEPVLKKIETEFPDLEIVVIADRKPEMELRSLHFVPWNKNSEAADLMKIDIGIMPLPDDEWAKGKCGFKALQYMSLGIPSVVSPVGVNTTIVKEGVNGYLASTHEQWIKALKTLMADQDLRKRMGESGRKTIIDRYSVISNSASFISLFD
jgi:glycosyltransferase involved in cell wall biosynthesis